LNGGDLFGIYTNSLLANEAIKIAKVIKSDCRKNKTVFGGPWASVNAEIAKKDFVDFVIKGEGEYAFRDLVHSIESGGNISDIKGVFYCESGKIKGTPPEKIENLDDLSFPAHDLFCLNRYSMRGYQKPFSIVSTSRGCPFDCIYCFKGVHGREFRKRSAENVVKEIRYIAEELGVKEVIIADDNFAVDRQRAMKICSLLIESNFDVKLNFIGGFHFNTVDTELLKKLKEAGTKRAAFGIESADRGVQKNINKEIDLQKAREIIRFAKKLNLITLGYFMFGLPGSDEKTMNKTLSFAKKVNPHYAYFSMAMPFPGTRLYEMIEETGEFAGNPSRSFERGYYSGEVFYQLDDMDPETIEKYFRRSYREFYMRPRKILELLRATKSPSELKWLAKAALRILRNQIVL